MANALVDSFRNGILGAHATRVDLDADNIGIMFVDGADDTPVVTDAFVSDILSAGRVPALASCPNLGTKTIGTVAVGTFDAADTTFTSLSGDQSEYLILFKNTGTDTTSDMIAIWDTATGLPITPNGADVTVQWNGSGILRI
jgi:hypothetical protein